MEFALGNLTYGSFNHFERFPFRLLYPEDLSILSCKTRGNAVMKNVTYRTRRRHTEYT